MISIIFIFIMITPNIYRSASASKGCWSDVEVVSTESTNFAYRAILAVDDNGTVHIAWKDKSNYSGSGRDWDVFYKKKPRDGDWTITEVVSTESTDSCNCLFLAVEPDGTVHVTWKGKTNYGGSGSDYDIFYKKKPSDGDWTITEVVSTESSSDSNCPWLTVDDNGTVHIAWSDGTIYGGSDDDWDVFYKKKPRDGDWTITEVVSTESSSISSRPSLGVDNNETVHITWEEHSDYGGSDDDWDVFYKKKPRDGNWTITEVVSTESTDDSLSPHLHIGPEGTVHVVWIDGTNYSGSKIDYDIFYKKQSNEIWSTTEIVSVESKHNCNWPYLIVDGNGTVHVAWNDHINYGDSGNDLDIFYSKKPKNGDWKEAEIVSSESTSDSHWPSLAVGKNGTIHISWWDDNGDNNWVTFYKKRYCENVTNNNNMKNDDETGIPGFELAMIMCAISFLFYWKSKRKI
jgi:hypothetical protein